MEYQVCVTPQAIEQIGQIFSYIKFTLREPETANRWAGFLQKEIAELCFMPSRYPLTEEEPWRSNGIRKMSVKNFLIYYLVDEEKKTVSVTAVIYGRRDQLAALGNLMQDGLAY